MARKKRKRLTANQQMFKRQAQRITRLGKRLLMKGIDVDPYITKLVKPKRISKKLISEMRSVRSAETFFEFEEMVKRRIEKGLYQDMLEESQQNKEKYDRKEDYIPDRTLVDEISARIYEMHTKNNYWLSHNPHILEHYKPTLIEVLEYNVHLSTEGGYFEAYNYFLEDNQATIFKAIEGMEYASEQPVMEDENTAIIDILNFGNPLAVDTKIKAEEWANGNYWENLYG